MDFKLENLEKYQIAIILTTLIFLVTSTISIIFYPNYDFINQYFSELGIGPTSIIFNFGIMITSIFLLIYFYLLFKKKENSKIFYLGLISSIGLFGVGLFPMNIIFWHFLSAATFFFTSLIIIGIKITQNKDNTKLLFFGLMMALVIFNYLLIFRIPFFQKLSVYAIIIYYIIYSFK